MKLHEIATPGKIIRKIAHSPEKRGERSKMIKKYLKKQAKKNNPDNLQGGVLPVDGGNFSGMF